MNMFLIGYLGTDPEERVTSSGKKVVNLSLATRCRSKDAETVWWRLSCWTSFPILAHLKKGSAVVVSAIMTRAPSTYVDKTGTTRVSLEATVVDISFAPFGKPDAENSDKQSSQQNSFVNAATPNSNVASNNDNWEKVNITEDIPF